MTFQISISVLVKHKSKTGYLKTLEINHLFSFFKNQLEKIIFFIFGFLTIFPDKSVKLAAAFITNVHMFLA
jgi:hypothetical protein